MKNKRQVLQYIIGLLILALGAVLLKKAELGMTPTTSTPAALTTVTGLSPGTTTMLHHVVCWLVILVLQRKINLKTVLILPLAVVFGWIVDGYLFLMSFTATALWVRFLINLCGIAATALGVVVIVGCNGLLPAPDALIRTVSSKYNIPLSKVKIAGDAFWVVVAFLIDLLISGKLFSAVGVGTVLSAILTGWLVGVFGKYCPWITMKTEDA